LQKPLQIPANGIVDGLRGQYRDPNGKSVNISGSSMVTPVSGTDYIANSLANGTGTVLTGNLTVTATYGTSEVKYKLQNTGATAMYVTTLQARGIGNYIYDAAGVLYESSSSIAKYGASEISLDMPYISDATDLFAFSNNYDLMLSENGVDHILMEDGTTIRLDDTAGIFQVLVSETPFYSIPSVSFIANRSKFDMLAFMYLEVGSSIKLSETMTGITSGTTWIINGMNIEIQPKPSGAIIKWTAVLLPSTQCPKA
jgi:hypothetical protein